MNAAIEAVDKARKTLKFLADEKTESKSAAHSATITAKGAKASYDLARASVDKAKQANVTAAQKHREGSENLKKQKEILDGKLGNLTSDKKVLQKELNDHIRVTPEIVAQHDLGF